MQTIKRTAGVVSGDTRDHALGELAQLAAISKRVKRAHGQLGAVVRLLEQGATCEDVVTQMAAVSKAVTTAAFTLISASLEQCLRDTASESAAPAEKFQKLFLSLA